MPFAPTELSGLLVWFDATQIDASDGDRVATWPDLSGNGHDATAVSNTRRPEYRRAIRSGRDALQFARAMMTTAAFSEVSQPTTVFIACAIEPANNAVLLDGIADGFRQQVTLFPSQNMALFAGSTVSSSLRPPLPAAVWTG